MRDSMVFYRNFRDALSKLPPEERLAAYEAIFDYALDDKRPGAGVAGAMVQLMIPAIDKNNQRYENGKRGGRPKNQTETKTKPNVTEPEPKCKVLNDKCEMLNESPIGDKSRNRKRFTPPTVEEVEAYCFERNNKVDPERFVDFYSSNGWKVGKNPMKDWKAAVRNWEKRDDRSSAERDEAARHEVLAKIAGGLL